MLVKSDLSQIRKIVREEVESEVGNSREEFSSGLRELKVDLATRIFRLEDRMKNNDIRIRREIKKLGDKMDGMDKFLDKNVMADRKRIDAIERHLGLPEPQTI